MPIPERLEKCPVCGEYRGTVRGVDLNWEMDNLNLTDELDYAEFQMRLEDLQSVFTVSCLCSGIPCPRCKVNKIHRPISNSYDEESNTIEHWAYFTGQMPCRECRLK